MDEDRKYYPRYGVYLTKRQYRLLRRLKKRFEYAFDSPSRSYIKQEVFYDSRSGKEHFRFNVPGAPHIKEENFINIPAREEALPNVVRVEPGLTEEEINENIANFNIDLNIDLEPGVGIGVGYSRKKGIEPDLPDVPDTDPEHYKHSVFFITINTNQKPNNYTEGSIMEQTLSDSIDYAFCAGEFTPSNSEEWRKRLNKLIVFLSPNARMSWENDGSQDTIDTAHIKSIEVKKSQEMGPSNRGRLHAHAIIRITHNSKLHLSLPGLKELLVTKLQLVGVINPYINVRALGDTLRNLEDYLEKNNEQILDVNSLDDLF